MPGMSGPELAQVVLQDFHAVRVIGMTSFEDDTVMDMLRAPVHGMLLKANTNGEEVSQCLFEVLHGFTYYTPEIQTKINSGQYKLHQRSRTLLTKRDQEILVCMSEGKSAKEIAEKLGLKVTTIEDYRKAMLRKTQTSNSAELMAFAHRNGLL
jgi:DNA-binding NarL/FixJ family response regulator